MFKDRFKELRTSYKYTQNEIADIFDVSVQAVYNWEKGIFMPTIDSLIKLAEFFSVSTDYLLGIDNKKYLDVSGLSTRQVAHLQQIVNDLKEASN